MRSAGGGIAVADVRGVGNASDVIVFHIDDPAGANGGYYRVGLGLDPGGKIDSWLPSMDMPFAVPGGWGDRTHGAGVAAADLTGSGMPDLILAHVDNAKERNIAYFRIGVDMRPNGTIAAGTNGAGFGGDVRQVSGWIGNTRAAADVAAADLDGDGVPELLFFHVDDPKGENTGFYRVGSPQRRSSDLVVRLNGSAAVEALNIPVWKSGRTTELTNGTITDSAWSGRVYNDFFGAEMLFEDLIYIEPRLGEAGDSGSVLVDDKNRAVGLFMAGADADENLESTFPSSGLACRIENVLDALRWSDRKPVGGGSWGASTAGAGLAVWKDGGVSRLIAVNVDNPDGPNVGWYRISAPPDSNGDVRGWTQARRIDRDGKPAWWGDETDEAGATVWDTGTARHLVVMHVDRRPGGNQAYYRVGWNLSSTGATADWGPAEWSEHMEIPGDFGERTPGAGIAVWKTPTGDHLVAFYLEASPGPKQGYYRVGWNLDPSTGAIKPADWGPPRTIPGWWGEESSGGGLAIADLWGNGDNHLVVFHIDTPGGSGEGFYRIGRLDPRDGTVAAADWSPTPIQIEGPLSPTGMSFSPRWDGPGDVAILDLAGNGAPDLVALDAAPDAGFYRIAYDLIESTQAPARWWVA
jgi:hypothetical protein